jgi:hypothetical protein
MPDYAPIWQIKASFVSKYRGEGCPRSRSTNCSIKGRSDKLKPLLNTLSYRHNGTSFANSDAHRTAIFLGDLINPKNDYLPNGTSEVLHSERTSITLFPLPVAMRVLPFLRRITPKTRVLVEYSQTTLPSLPLSATIILPSGKRAKACTSTPFPSFPFIFALSYSQTVFLPSVTSGSCSKYREREYFRSSKDGYHDGRRAPAVDPLSFASVNPTWMEPVTLTDPSNYFFYL